MDKNDIKHILGQRIKEERINKGLGQKELAEKIGKSVGNISGYETSDRMPPADILCDMANIFECTTDYLLGRTDYRTGKVIEKEANNHKYKIVYDHKKLQALKKLSKLLDDIDGLNEIIRFIEDDDEEKQHQ